MTNGHQAVQIPQGDAVVHGDLVLPEGALGLVVFAHGSGSSRHSPRNRMVAEHLQQLGLATLLMDLLTAAEESIDLRTRQLRFDIGLLAERLASTAAWSSQQPATASLPLGYFGASTGAGAALVAAALEPDHVGAVVSRGGRPDLAAEHLPGVQAPTLLLVGGDDDTVIDLNEQAAERLRVEHRLAIVPGASHLFEEPGTLEEVARLAGDWFLRHLPAAQTSPSARNRG